MIIVRDIFRLKFGQAKEATALWKQGIEIIRQAGYGGSGIRLLTDLAGESYYTLVLESTHDSLEQWEQAERALRANAAVNAAWRSLYEKLIPLTETGRREILRVVE